MSSYDEPFASIYNQFWSDYARSVAPRIRQFYEICGGTPQSVLDLCCGTGQLALEFLTHGYQVVGLDQSAAMLRYAREHARDYVGTGQVQFVEADATDFTLESPVGLTVSTYNSLNHLADVAALYRCFCSVREALVDGGCFVADFKTRRGLMHWNNTSIQNSEQSFIVMKGSYDGLGARAETKIVAFLRQPDGTYRRVDQTLVNTVFDMSQTEEALREAGYRSVHFGHIRDLSIPVRDPETEARVFVVARK